MTGDAMIDTQARAGSAGFFACATRLIADRPVRAVAIAAALITALRVLVLIFAEANLGPDEAQYWVWSKALDWGYFSKPPLIAWIIAATTSAFGQSEWAVRLAAPFLHGGAACVLALLARRLYGPAPAFWVGAGWLTMPGVSLSSFLITTDAPLLFFWSLALFLFFAAADVAASPRRRLALAAGLGAAIGLGFLAKYAMIYFVLGAGLAVIVSPEVRRGFSLPALALAAAAALIIVAPNLLWNAEHDFQTLSHTAANANWNAAAFQLAGAAAFLGAQAGVFGPILLGLFVWGLLPASKRIAGPRRGPDAALLAFALPPLVIVTAQAFISRAHANWAATAYPAAIILVVSWAFRSRLGSWIKASTALHLAVAALLSTMLISFPIADAVGAGNMVKRVRGWAPQGEAIARAAAGYDVILVDDREIMGSLLYYAKGGPKIVAWNSNGAIESHYEAFMRFNPSTDKRALFVTPYSDPRGVAGAFDIVEPRGSVAAEINGKKPRVLYLFEVAGPKG